MQSMIPDSEIHLGHRERMRRKLATYGGEIFDTYELLEMLLYNVIPVRDTNPVAKRLLARFGSLDGVFNAELEELMEVDGIGEATAGYITNVSALPELVNSDNTLQQPLLTYSDIGRFLVKYFEGCYDYRTVMVLLDNAMRVIDVAELYQNDYDRGNVMSNAFIDAAISLGASCVAIAHNHPYGPLFPSHADLVTNGMILLAFKHTGINVAEHYLVSGDEYIGINGMTYLEGDGEIVDALDMALIEAESRREDDIDI